MKNYFSIFILILIHYGCKKKDFPQNQSENPAFYISAEINGTPLRLNAGDNGYYMFSEYSQDSSGIYTFISSFKKQNCGSSCPLSFKIELTDNQVSTIAGNSNIQNSLKTISYLFADSTTHFPLTTGYKASFVSSFNGNALAYAWNFGDGNSSTVANPTHTFTSSGIYSTCLQIDGGTAAESICNPVKISPFNVCRTTVQVNSINGKTISFGNYTSGSGPFTFRWEFGDGNFSSSPNPVHTYDAEGIYQVSLTASNSSGDTAVHYYNVNTGSSLKPAPNFSVQSISKILSFERMFSRIKFSYVNENGVVFSSFNRTQPAESNFNIESIDEFEENTNGKKTKKIKVNFRCTLYNSNTTLNIRNGVAVIALAYPD